MHWKSAWMNLDNKKAPDRNQALTKIFNLIISQKERKSYGNYLQASRG